MRILDHLPPLPFNFKSNKHSNLSGGAGISSNGEGLGSEGGGKREESNLNGIESIGIGARGRARGRFDDEDGTSTLNLALRGIQTFLPFINLCIYIAIASYQKSWSVGPSFLSVLAIIVNIQSLIHGALFLSTPLMYEQFSFLRGIARALRQIRIGIVVNGFQTILMFLMGLITSISAYSGGCKDASSDDNAQLPGYTDSMGPFCRNKRAGAAFFWFNFIAWSITLALVLSMWYNVRKYPQSTGFAIPDVENHDNNENDELVFDSSITPSLPNIGYRPSGDYYSSDQGLFTESAQGYENRNNYNNNQHQQQNYHHPTVVNPFEDQGNDGATGGQYERSYADVDPYEAIRKSMDVNSSRPSY